LFLFFTALLRYKHTIWIYPFKVYNSVVLIIFTKCNHHNLILEYFCSPREVSCLIFCLLIHKR
jgi:hypothetical protein